MNYVPFVVILAVLVIVAVILLAYRRKLTAWEDDSIHIHEGEEQATAAQEVLARKISKVDLVGKVLTVIIVVGALVLAAVFVYSQFADTGVRMG